MNFQDPATLAKLDAWRNTQTPPPTRTGCIRAAILMWLVMKTTKLASKTEKAEK